MNDLTELVADLRWVTGINPHDARQFTMEQCDRIADIAKRAADALERLAASRENASPSEHRCVESKGDDCDLHCSCGETFIAKRLPEQVNAFVEHFLKKCGDNPCGDTEHGTAEGSESDGIRRARSPSSTNSAAGRPALPESLLIELVELVAEWKQEARTLTSRPPIGYAGHDDRRCRSRAILACAEELAAHLAASPRRENASAKPLPHGYVEEKISPERVAAIEACKAELRGIEQQMAESLCKCGLTRGQHDDPTTFVPGDAAGDWPEDFASENGNYQRECVFCGSLFMGHKRRVVCKLCETDPGRRAIIKRNADRRDSEQNASVHALVALVEKWRARCDEYHERKPDADPFFKCIREECADELERALAEQPT